MYRSDIDHTGKLYNHPQIRLIISVLQLDHINLASYRDNVGEVSNAYGYIKRREVIHSFRTDLRDNFGTNILLW